MAGRVVKKSVTKELTRIGVGLLLLMVSTGFGFTQSGFSMGKRGVAKDVSPAIWQDAAETRNTTRSQDIVKNAVQEAVQDTVQDTAQARDVSGKNAVDGLPVVEVAQVASPGTADPIDQLLSSPSPYETKLTDSKPKRSRSSGTSQANAKKKRLSAQASAEDKGKPTGRRDSAAEGGTSHAIKETADKEARGEEKPDDGEGTPGASATVNDDTDDTDYTDGRGAGEKKAEPAPKDTEASKKTNVHLFGTVALFPKAISSKTSPQWYRVMMTQQAPPPIFSNGTAKRMPAAVAKRWFALRKKIEGADNLTKIKEVNKFFNTWPYRTDDVVWGVPEYWATPEEFLEKSGDCEDYAITKYYALRSLGFSADILRIVAVKDTIRGIGHAVLAVLHEDTAYILDNLSPYVLEHTVLKNYRPQFSVNENYRWGHARIVNKK